MRLLIVCLLTLISLGACRKCEVCKVYDSQGNFLPDSNRVCGRKADLEKAEETAALRAGNIGGTYSCEPD
ncbi:MAG: hypothetical protein IT240_10190 [Bacteroidia bacterium]|jgi:hypothetical protein|nr:hypothetical protein [Bacteroidia bacterium]